MSALADACHHPFSNGTEERAWQSVWCENCTHDHSMHDPGEGPGCPILLDYLVNNSEPGWWPEAWLPEPTGTFSLPSRMTCAMFEPCTEPPCSGDPQPEVRAAIVAEVSQFWRDQSEAPDHA